MDIVREVEGTGQTISPVRHLRHRRNCPGRASSSSDAANLDSTFVGLKSLVSFWRLDRQRFQTDHDREQRTSFKDDDRTSHHTQCCLDDTERDADGLLDRTFGPLTWVELIDHRCGRLRPDPGRTVVLFVPYDQGSASQSAAGQLH